MNKEERTSSCCVNSVNQTQLVFHLSTLTDDHMEFRRVFFFFFIMKESTLQVPTGTAGSQTHLTTNQIQLSGMADYPDQ